MSPPPSAVPRQPARARPAASASAVASDPPSALAQLTPTEAALLYADLLLPSFPDAFAGAYRVPLSGRYLDVESLGQLMAETLIGALTDASGVVLASRGRRGALPPRPFGFLRVEGAGPDYPPESLEARAASWLDGQPSREAWLDDLFQHVVLPARSPSPEREGCDLALSRLERSGMVVPLVRRVLRLNKMREHDVTDRHRRVLSRVDERDVRARVSCRTRITPVLQVLVREGWREAVARRTDEG
jgi:hypothetical protein